MKIVKIKLHTIVAAITMVLPLMATAAVKDTGQMSGEWTKEAQQAFYTTDQGSRLIPLKWIEALKYKGESFMTAEGGLTRYGYLSNSNGTTNLPIGFNLAKGQHGQTLGMTCAACHTRELKVNGEAYLVDGGPAFADFGRFMIDLNKAVAAVQETDKAFNQFAKKVLGDNASDTDKQDLQSEFQYWFSRFNAIIKGSLTPKGEDKIKNLWGPGRLDAVAMIFNRLTGLDIGKKPPFIIHGNIMPADAPVRYPFLWNAARQGKTQWPGFADNGNDLLGLARNLGEVYGVFADFHPVKKWWGLDYLKHNSANFSGLKELEDLIWEIKPPKWQWGSIDAELVRKGKKVFNRPTGAGGCVECHGINTYQPIYATHPLWKTPLVDVGTDSREYQILIREVDTGIMNGAFNVSSEDSIFLGKTASAFDVLAAAVVGSIVQHEITSTLSLSEDEQKEPSHIDEALANITKHYGDLIKHPIVKKHNLQGAFNKSDVIAKLQATLQDDDEHFKFKYESRVLHGIWAAAPYLHNASVPTLEDLLQPAHLRPKSFKIGPNYDIKKVGLAAEQPGNYVIDTTGPRDSGNSNQGHEFGTSLPPKDKKALLEYLKTL